MRRIISFLLSIIFILSSLLLIGCNVVKDYCPHTIGTGQIIPSESASCTEGGLTEGKRCLVCGEILLAQEIISPLGHDFEYLTEVDEDVEAYLNGELVFYNRNDNSETT